MYMYPFAEETMMSANELDHARTLLNRIPATVQHTSDLDLLVFFARHSRTLMTSGDLARLLGYQIKEIAKSLEVLLKAGLLTRTQNPTSARRLYVFETGGTNSAWLPAFVEFASTREGRMDLSRALTQKPRADEEQGRKR